MHIAVIAPADPREFASDLTRTGDVSRDEIPVGLGGVPVNALVRSLLDLGHRVTLFTASTGATSVWRADGPLLRVVVVPFRVRPRSRALDFFRRERRALAAEIARCDADVFHAHWTYEFALAAIDAGAEPLVVTAHDAPLTVLRHLPDPYRLLRLALALRVRLRARTLTAVSPYLATSWRRQMLYASPIAIVPNPIPTLATAARTQPAGPVILDLADASRLKNVTALLRAFPSVRTRHPGAQLRLAGGGLGPHDALAGWAANTGLAAGVHFLGTLTRAEVARELAGATVFCHPSLEEAQPMCLLEAMSARVPVVAGERSGGVPWTLFGGEAGMLVDVTSPKSIGAALTALIDSPERSAECAERAFELVTARFAPATIAARYLEVYAGAMAAGASRRRVSA